MFDFLINLILFAMGFFAAYHILDRLTNNGSAVVFGAVICGFFSLFFVVAIALVVLSFFICAVCNDTPKKRTSFPMSDPWKDYEKWPGHSGN